jgi:superfamily II DNA/RNA helicase
MPFKKLIQPLKDSLETKGFESPLPFQKLVLSKIKSGASLFCIAPKGSGKTTSIVLSVIQKLKGKAVEDAPRVLIFVKDKQAALSLELEFNAFKYGTDLRIYCAYDEYDIDKQRDDVYDGVDVIICTPKRLNKIFYLNGINLNKLQMFILEDAEFVFGNSNLAEVTRTPESISKCQYLIFSSKYDKRFDRWKESFMYNAQTVKM